MKHLWLIRHATAESGEFSKPDFERSLEETGIKEALKTGEFIANKKLIPELIISSSARRTLETANEINTAFPLPILIESNHKLYNAGFQTLIRSISEANSKIETLALVAHNPGISQLATTLATKGAFQMAPSAAVCFQFQINTWDEIGAGKGKEIFYFYP